jgi:hypothetical protein
MQSLKFSSHVDQECEFYPASRAPKKTPERIVV